MSKAPTTPQVDDLKAGRVSQIPYGLADLKAAIQAITDPNAKKAIKILAKMIVGA